MAPRTRSGKGLDVEEAAAHRKALRNGPVNTQGLPALPTELLLEIISHLPTVSFPCYLKKPLDGSYLLRVQLIRGLSQMCRSLRRVFLPLAFERIEVCALKDVEHSGPIPSRYRRRRLLRDSDAKTLATELIRQLEVVTIRDPSLAQYVKIVNVYIERFSAEAVIEELFRCLPLFPALNTVQFMGTNWTLAEYVQKTLKKDTRLPSVTKVLYAPYARAALKCFPNAKYIAPTRSLWFESSFRDELGHVQAHCPDAEDVYGMENSERPDSIERNLKAMVDSVPKLRVVRFGISHRVSPCTEHIKQTSRLRDLRSINFQIQCTSDCSKCCQLLEKPELPSLINTAINILKAKPDSVGPVKSVSVLRTSGRTIFYITVNHEGYTSGIDDLGLLPRLNDARADVV